MFIFLRRASDALLSIAARIIARTAFLKFVRLLIAQNASNHTASCAASTIVLVGLVDGLSDAYGTCNKLFGSAGGGIGFV